MLDYEVVSKVIYDMISFGLKDYSDTFREAYVYDLVKRLKAERFMRRKKDGPAHPKGVRRKSGRLKQLDIDLTQGRDYAIAILRIIRPYFNADTQRNTVRTLVRLLEERPK